MVKTSSKRKKRDIIELAIRDLDIEKNPSLRMIFQKVKDYGLSLCPLEIGPYFRLSYRDQKEENEYEKNKAPKGSITIISKPLKEGDETFPKGFYIRKMDGVLWLRGYNCSMEYIWDINDRIALMI